jgi:hypothetical protein
VKLLALGLLSLGLVLIAFGVWENRESPQPRPSFHTRSLGLRSSEPDSDYWSYPSEQGLEFYYKLKGENSVKGQRSFDDLHVDVIVLGQTGTPADDTVSPYRVYKDVKYRLLKPNDSWSGSQSLKGTDVSEASIELDVKVEAMPKDEDLWGRDAKLVASGRVSFPHKISNDEYIDRNTTFREEIPFRFANRAEKEKYEAGYKEYQQQLKEVDDYNKRTRANYVAGKLLSLAAGLLLIGTAVWLFIRSRRVKSGHSEFV